jgi:hypothetical protein
MTTKEKAIELFEKYYSHNWQVHKSTRSYGVIGTSKSAAKYFALIAVDEILNVLNSPPIKNESMLWKSQHEYYLQVRTEIENL